MSQLSQSISTREISKDKVVALLQYGDIQKIAERTPYCYDYVSRIIRKKKENDAVWAAALSFLDSRSNLEISLRLQNLVGHEAA